MELTGILKFFNKYEKAVNLYKTDCFASLIFSYAQYLEPMFCLLLNVVIA